MDRVLKEAHLQTLSTKLQTQTTILFWTSQRLARSSGTFLEIVNEVLVLGTSSVSKSMVYFVAYD